jgi:hypothetical protein
MTIVATPLDLPIIEPDNWDVFWELWYNNKKPLEKTMSNGAHSEAPIGSTDTWQGIDIFTAHDIPTVWQAPLVDIKNSLPKLYNTCATLPFKTVYRVRLVESLQSLGAHTDDNINKWSVRAYFHYTDPNPQWYFSKPIRPAGEKYYFNLPKETNWFGYNDKLCYHGTDYNPLHPKILLQVYMLDSPRLLVYNSMAKYKEHTLSL